MTIWSMLAAYMRICGDVSRVDFSVAPRRTWRRTGRALLMPDPRLRAQRGGWRTGLAMFLALATSACTADSRQHVYIAGDSTASQYAPEHAPQAGWGQALAYYLNDDVVVDNRASSGRSSKSYVDEGRWKDVISDVRDGDIVLISFGHNDARDDSPQRFTRPQGEYRDNLKRFAHDVLNKNAHPVILSPVARRLWESSVMVETHGLYRANAQIAAREANASFIDLSHRSLTYFEGLGEAPSKRDFLWLQPDAERARFPQGVEDNTHFSELGACGVARVIALALRALPATASVVADHVRVDEADPAASIPTANGPAQRPASVRHCAANLPRD